MITASIIISAFVVGFAGSFHCMGMCGPLALSIVSPRGGVSPKELGTLFYFVGKSFTYTVLGFLIGLFGHQMALAGLQQSLSIITGLAMLFFVVITFFKPVLFHKNPVTNYINQLLLPVFGRLISKQHSIFKTLGLGALNGLLPCGLVYIGLTAAFATGQWWSAGLFMFVFALGTMPVMFSFLWLSNHASMPLRNLVQKATPVFMTIIGVVLILRGLDLGIPFISPTTEALMLTGDRGQDAVPCHP